GTEQFSTPQLKKGIRVIAAVDLPSVEPEAEGDEIERTAKGVVESRSQAWIGELGQWSVLQVRRRRRSLYPLDRIERLRLGEDAAQVHAALAHLAAPERDQLFTLQHLFHLVERLQPGVHHLLGHLDAYHPGLLGVRDPL